MQEGMTRLHRCLPPSCQATPQLHSALQPESTHKRGRALPTPAFPCLPPRTPVAQLCSGHAPTAPFPAQTHTLTFEAAVGRAYDGVYSLRGVAVAGRSFLGLGAAAAEVGVPEGVLGLGAGLAACGAGALTGRAARAELGLTSAAGGVAVGCSRAGWSRDGLVVRCPPLTLGCAAACAGADAGDALLVVLLLAAAGLAAAGFVPVERLGAAAWLDAGAGDAAAAAGSLVELVLGAAAAGEDASALSTPLRLR